MASQTFTAAQVLTAAQMNTLANTVDGYATTATAAGTTTLTVASYYQQFFTGSTTQTVVMPVASTLVVGWKIRVVNNSSGVVTVQSSGANTIYAVPAGSDVIFTCILASGTTAASWDYKDYKVSSGTSPGVVQLAQTVLGANAASVVFSSISSSYTNLRIVFQARSALVGSDDQFAVRLNGDTGSNYNSQTLDAAGSSVSASDATPANIIYATKMPASTATSGYSVSGDLVIPNYKATTFNKIVLGRGLYGLSSAANNTKWRFGGGMWLSTAAVTSVTLFAGSADLLAGSVFTLYGEL